MTTATRAGTADMPQYEWECPNCGHQESLICTLAEKPDQPECPKCMATLEWVPQRNGQAFKGRGWTPKHYPQTEH